MSESNQRQVAETWISTFATLDTARNISLRSPTCIHTMAPTSLGGPAPLDNETFAAHLDGLKPVLSAFPVYAKEYIEQGRCVSVWAGSEAFFRDEVTEHTEGNGVEWKYEGEYLFMLFFDEKGEKIERILEFIDSKKGFDGMGLMKRARGIVAGRAEGKH